MPKSANALSVKKHLRHVAHIAEIKRILATFWNVERRLVSSRSGVVANSRFGKISPRLERGKSLHALRRTAARIEAKRPRPFHVVDGLDEERHPPAEPRALFAEDDEYASLRREFELDRRHAVLRPPVADAPFVACFGIPDLRLEVAPFNLAEVRREFLRLVSRVCDEEERRVARFAA